MTNIFEESRKEVKTGQRALLLVIFVSEDVGPINSHESDSARVPVISVM